MGRDGALNSHSQAEENPSTAALNTARNQLETSQPLPGVENYQQWRERNQLEGHLSIKDSAGNVTGFLTPNQTAQRYLDEMKARPGWRKLAGNISTSLTAGGGQVVAGVLGGTVHAPPPLAAASPRAYSTQAPSLKKIVTTFYFLTRAFSLYCRQYAQV